MKHPGTREIEELKKLVTKSIRDKDLPYTRQVSRLWGITTVIGFICTQFLYQEAHTGNAAAHIFIYLTWALIIVATILLRQRLYPKPEVVSYLSVFYGRLWAIAWTAQAVCVALLMWHQQYHLIGAFIAVIVGLAIGAGGVLFGSSVQITSGVIYMLASLPIAYFWREQFFIFAALQILVLVIGPLFWRTRDE
jgi:NAD/NADP transhydrogenase beta subunit